MALIFVLAGGGQAGAKQDFGTPYDIYSSAPEKPAGSIVELLGRYENIKNNKDSFLLLEDMGTVEIVYDKNNETGKNIIKLTESCRSGNLIARFEYECTTGKETVEFIKSDKYEKFYCVLHGNIYRQVIYGGENGGTYKIKPLKSINELRKTAFSVKPPREADATAECDLVNLRKIGGNMKFDIRYATDNNFMGEKFYESQGAYLQRPAAYSLLYTVNSLARYGLGIIVYDAYRPWYVTKMFYDATPDAQKNFVADPSKGSRHNRGTAVDIGLYDLKTGRLIDMGSGYDEFSERASPKFQGATSYSRWHRKLIEYYMGKAGFTVYEDEWWHFDYKLNVVKYPLINKTFEQINKKK